jgi:pimeloyl-ACP methyl ester carboxylesterase
MDKTMTKADTVNKNEHGEYAPVNGLLLYYEIHGTGEPLVLLHGGVGASEMFSPNLSGLSATRKLIAVHLQAHGHTTDINRPLQFEAMADDIAGLLKHLKLEHADILGYSLGGGVALQTAIRHPDAVRKLVLISTPFKQQGFYPDVLANMAQMGPDAAKFMNQSPLYQLYPAVDWAALFKKLGNLLRQDYDWSMGVAAMKMPVMIVYADADAIYPAHVIEFYRMLGGGQRDAGLDGSARATARLAILPGMTHYDVLTFPGLPDMLTSFLDTPMPKAG